jgi:uncharacterized protein
MSRRIEWDLVKAESYRKKHGISFETATRAFSDPFAVTEIQDARLSEHRWQTIAVVDGTTLLLVVHTDWEEGEVEVTRLISARLAERHERRRYEDNYRQIRN